MQGKSGEAEEKKVKLNVTEVTSKKGATVTSVKQTTTKKVNAEAKDDAEAKDEAKDEARFTNEPASGGKCKHIGEYK